MYFGTPRESQSILLKVNKDISKLMPDHDM